MCLCVDACVRSSCTCVRMRVCKRVLVCAFRSNKPPLKRGEVGYLSYETLRGMAALPLLTVSVDKILNVRSTFFSVQQEGLSQQMFSNS